MAGCKDLLKVPNEKISGLGLSFREIAVQLCLLKKRILSYPRTQDFLLNPYGKTKAEIEELDIFWQTIGNQFVNDKSNIPAGYGRNCSFIANNGKLFIDVFTFEPGKDTNNSIVEISLNQNIAVVPQPTQPVYITNTDSPPFPYNPQEIDISNLINNPSTQVNQYRILSALSKTPPNLDLNNLKPEKYTATKFFFNESASSRKEIIQAVSQKYGWASRYGELTFSPSYFVATTIDGNDGYQIWLRISYYKLPL